MVFITKFALGTLSEIYYEAQCTLLNTWELFSGQVCRAIVGMVIFHKISDSGRHSFSQGVASSVQSQSLALTSEAVGEAEKTAGTLAARTSCEERKAGKAQHTLDLTMLKTELLELFESQESLDHNEIETLQQVLAKILEDGQPISQFSFVQAVVNSDIGSLKGWATLFDQDRKPCCLEKLFDTQRSARRKFHDEIVQSALGQSDATIVGTQPSSGLAESPPAQTPMRVEETEESPQTQTAVKVEDSVDNEVLETRV